MPTKEKRKFSKLNTRGVTQPRKFEFTSLVTQEDIQLLNACLVLHLAKEIGEEILLFEKFFNLFPGTSNLCSRHFCKKRLKLDPNQTSLGSDHVDKSLSQ